jgi:hypothetical protein
VTTNLVQALEILLTATRQEHAFFHTKKGVSTTGFRVLQKGRDT